MIATAVCCSALAVALLVRPRPRVRTMDRSLPARSGVAVVLVGAFLLLHGRHLVLALILGTAAAGALVIARRARARKLADETRARVVEAFEAVVAELRAGRPPLQSLERGLEVWPVLAPVVAAARLDADVPECFRRLSRQPGAEALEEVAASWQVAHRLGTGLAASVARAVDAARAQLATRRIVAAELASARATARTVAALPVLLLLVSSGSGSGPWHFLLETPAGLGCLAAGLLLALAGMAWIDRIVTRVEAEWG